MSNIPVIVLKTSIISVVLDNLFPSDFEAWFILIFGFGQIDQFVDMLASEGCLAVVSSNRRSHFWEHHSVIFRHFKLLYFKNADGSTQMSIAEFPANFIALI